jgi:hypothetical protein
MFFKMTFTTEQQQLSLPISGMWLKRKETRVPGGDIPPMIFGVSEECLPVTTGVCMRHYP